MKKYIKCDIDEYSDEYSDDVSYSSFDPFYGRKYFVSGGYDGFTTDDVDEAIVGWFRLSELHPYDTYILAKTRKDAMNLLASADEKFITELYNTYKCGYKLEYLLESIKRNYSNGCKYFHESEYGDQVDPFSVG